MIRLSPMAVRIDDLIIDVFFIVVVGFLLFGLMMKQGFDRKVVKNIVFKFFILESLSLNFFLTRTLSLSE